MAETLSAVRDEAVEALRAADLRLNSVEFLAAMPDMSQAERTAAAKARTETQIAVQRLRAAELSAISARLEAESDAVKKATGDLRKALEDLQTIKPFLDGVAALLGVVGRIVRLI